MNAPVDQRILDIQQKLHEHFGSLHWWPAESPFEVATGAILTQNTAWTNVEYAIDNLRQAKALTPAKIAGMPLADLQELIRPAGFYRQKSARLQNLAEHLIRHWQGDITALCRGPLDEARKRLLSLPGVGQETADSILLYAAERASFVIDAYTQRIFTRVGVLHGQEPYDAIRRLFMQSLPEDVALFNEYHAQIVELAKTCCRKKRPACMTCPIRELCDHACKKTSPDII